MLFFQTTSAMNIKNIGYQYKNIVPLINIANYVFKAMKETYQSRRSLSESAFPLNLF